MATQAPVKVYEGQRDAAGITELMRANAEAREAARAAFLVANPDYIACAVAGCNGLVAPAFQRKGADGTSWGLCPRRAQHAALMPDLFGPAAMERAERRQRPVASRERSGDLAPEGARSS